MPKDPDNGAARRPTGPDDVAAMVAELRDVRGNRRFSRQSRELTNRFAYLAGVHPEWFAPFQEAVLTDPELFEGFGPSFADQCVLLREAPDRCVEHLLSVPRDDGEDIEIGWALAAIGTPAALDAVAWHARNGGSREEYEKCGVWIPPTGPAQYRFTPHRRAVFRHPAATMAEVRRSTHPVGLPVDAVARDPDRTAIAWHYLTLSLAEVPGLPDWPVERIHLVGPRHWSEWSLTARFDEHGRYHSEQVVADDEEYADEEDGGNLDDLLPDDAGDLLGWVELRPYDADLKYDNGHIDLTPGVVGTAGGPPAGIYAAPGCDSCGRLMFHVVSVEHHVRDYGDGRRSLYVCEDCQSVTCAATGWN
jgi:hypothetical protein